MELPGLSGASPEEVANLTAAAADALLTDQPLPGVVEDFPLDESSGDVVEVQESASPAAFLSRGVAINLASSVKRPSVLAGVIANGYPYEQTNWIQRLVTTGGGGTKTTDRVDLRWVTNPGGVSSRIDYTMKYFPNSGQLSNIRALARAFTVATPNGQTGWKQQNVGSISRTLNNAPTVKGKTIKRVLELAATTRSGQTLSDQESSGTAKCELGSNRCKY